MQHLTKQEVLQWKQDKVTKHYFELLENSRRDIIEFIASGGCVGNSTDETAQELARELGKVKALDDILSFAIEDLIDGAISEEEDE